MDIAQNPITSPIGQTDPRPTPIENVRDTLAQAEVLAQAVIALAERVCGPGNTLKMKDPTPLEDVPGLLPSLSRRADAVLEYVRAAQITIQRLEEMLK